MTAEEVATKEPNAVTQAAPLPVTEAPSAPPPDTDVLGRLLRMAEAYLAAGAIHHAVEMYFKLIERHQGTEEANRARARLFEIAELHELAAQRHQARGIYERLL